MEIQLLGSRLFVEYGGVRRYLGEDEERIVAPPRGILGKLFRFVAWWKRLAGFSYQAYPDKVGAQLLTLEMQYSALPFGSSVVLDSLHKLSVDAGDLTEPLQVVEPPPEVWSWIRKETSGCALLREVIVPASEAWYGVAWSEAGHGTWSVSVPPNDYVTAMLRDKTPLRAAPTWGDLVVSADGAATSLPVNAWDFTRERARAPWCAWWRSLRLRDNGGLFARRAPGTQYDPWLKW